MNSSQGKWTLFTAIAVGRSLKPPGIKVMVVKLLPFALLKSNFQMICILVFEFQE